MKSQRTKMELKELLQRRREFEMGASLAKAFNFPGNGYYDDYLRIIKHCEENIEQITKQVQRLEERDAE